MLHLVPALLILLLQGPGGLEKLAHDGRCPEAVSLLRSIVLQQSAQAPSGQPGNLSNASPEATLSAIRSSSKDFGKLLQALAALYADEVEKPAIQPPLDRESAQDPPPHPHAIGSLQDGFIANSRTRDGPR